MKEVETLLKRTDVYVKSSELLHYEGDFDSSVSRSYYAMFFTAEALLANSRIEFSSHKSVISQFGKHFVKTGIFKPKFGRNLRRAFERRLIGDYSYASQITKDESLEALGWAHEFIAEIRDYLKGQTVVDHNKDK
jgi:uncharacterized protein (UPF0332 family)